MHMCDGPFCTSDADDYCGMFVDGEECRVCGPIWRGDITVNFGQALQALKQGKKVTRQGWNGKGQWVVLMPSLYLPPYSTQEPGAKVNDRTAKHIGVDTPLDSQPYFALFNAQGKWQPGWVPSVSDSLADDWEVVE